MPMYRVKTPDGKIYRIEGPKGASKEEVLAAVQSRLKGTEEQQTENGLPTYAPEKESGVIAQAKRGAREMISSMQTAGEALVGSPEEAAKRALARSEEISSQYEGGPSLERLKQAYEESGILGAGKELVGSIPEALAGQGANIGTAIAGARLGAMAGAPLGPVGAGAGALAGALIPSYAQQFGGDIERQAQEQLAAKKEIQIDTNKAAIAAAPQAVLDVVSEAIPLGRTILGNLLGKEVKQLLAKGEKKALIEAEKLAEERLAKTLAKGTALGAATEIPTETTQALIERWQAGLPLTDDDALREYGETAYQVSLLGPIGALGRVAERGAAREELAKREAPPGEAPAVTPSQPTPPVAPPELPPEAPAAAAPPVESTPPVAPPSAPQAPAPTELPPEAPAPVAPPEEPRKPEQLTLPGIPEPPPQAAAPAVQPAPEPEVPEGPTPQQIEMKLPQGREPKVDPLYPQAVQIVQQTGRAGVSTIQGVLGIGWGRAAKLIKQMEVDGIVSPPDEKSARTVLSYKPIEKVAPRVEPPTAGPVSPTAPVAGTTGAGVGVPVQGRGTEGPVAVTPPDTGMVPPAVGARPTDEGKGRGEPPLTLPRVAPGQPLPDKRDQLSLDPPPEEVDIIERGVRGKNIHQVASFVEQTAPHPATRLIARKVKEQLRALESKKTGISYQFNLVDNMQSLIPRDRRALEDSRGVLLLPRKGEFYQRVLIRGRGATSKPGEIGSSYRTVLHELAHAATVSSIRAGKSAAAFGTKLGRDVRDLQKVARVIMREAAAVRQKPLDQLTDVEKKLRRTTNFAIKENTLEEIVSWGLTDPDAQAWLETVPYDRNTSLWEKFVLTIRDMLGLPAGSQTALAEVLRVSGNILEADIDELAAIQKADKNVFAEPTTVKEAVEKAVSGVNLPANLVNDFPRFDDSLKEKVLNALSNISPSLRNAVNGFMTMPQLAEMYGKFLPTIEKLVSTLNERANRLMVRREQLNKNRLAWYKVAKKYQKLWPKFCDIANESTRLQVHFDPSSPEYDKNNALTKQFEALPKELQDTYFEILDDYRQKSDEFLNLLSQNLTASEMSKLRANYESKRLKIYLPLFREGEYWVTYQDKKNETVTLALGSQREQRMVAEWAAKNSIDPTSIRVYSRMSQPDWKQMPPSGFVGDVVKALSAKGIPDATLNSVYETFLNYLPSESIRQQFRTRQEAGEAKGILGFEPDVLQVYSNVATRMANQLTNMEYALQIERHMEDIRSEAGEKPDKMIKDVVNTIDGQVQYMRDPKNGTLANRLSYFSYLWYIAGNVSSAVVNTTQLPMVVYPLLGGKYGMGRAFSAMNAARATYMKGGWDDNSEFMPDWTAAGNKSLTANQKELMNIATRQGAIRRSTGYELAEARKVRTEDYVGLRANVEHAMGWVFQNSERLNREITLLAAYDLAIKDGKEHGAAVREAIQFVNDAHGTSLAETGPRFFQNDIGKVMFTFKRFAQAQIYLLARLFNQAITGLDGSPEEKAAARKEARKQLLGIYGMTYLFAGAQGLPLYGAISLLASLTMDDDDEPFDSDASLRKLIGDLGYKGPVNQAFGIDVASRTGFNGLLWRDDPKRLAEVGPFLYAAELAMGPAYSAFQNGKEGLKQFNEGHYERGIEAMTPTFVRNGLKALRLGTEDARTKDGVPIVEDISKYNVFMQVLGFNPVELAEARARAGAMKSADKKLETRRKAIFDQIDMARVNGDIEGLQEARAAARRFSMKNPDRRITPANIQASYRERRRKERESVDGVSLSSKVRHRLMDKYGA